MNAPTRRAFVLGCAGLGAGLALDACSSTPPSPYTTADLRTVALAAALENQAVSAYQALDAALRAGRLGRPDPALEAFVRTATTHHTAHATTWNTILRDARKPVVSGVPLTDHGSVMHTIAAASSVAGALSALRDLERRTAQTHVAAAGSLRGDGPAVLAAATIAPVEAMHAATLDWLSGGRSGVTSPLGTGGAASPRELTA
ncbi:ferritin-like domain-containing protein [Streptacidiphilus melanogenes]|uniref:ferritin-like domain-containing protein n=1 Tax=Streptacidiphilus melanogenes TaxID=411235 RepID=UPI000694E95E|nr:ferritin-like domain-containing protein [Streptacidiphilus melanogenes]